MRVMRLRLLLVVGVALVGCGTFLRLKRDVKILDLLARNRGKAVSRDRFFDECWGFDFLPNSRCLDQHVSQLRRRIESDPTSPAIIKTVHGVGYRFE